MLKNFEELLEKARGMKPRKVSVAAAEDEAVMRALKRASELGFVEPVLVGDGLKIRKIARDMNWNSFEVIECEGEQEAVEKAVSLVSHKKADVLMKGIVNTSVYMRGILNREYGLRTGRLLSLLAVYELPQYHKLIYCTDSGINVAPGLEQKKMILKNALEAMQNLGFHNPKTAMLTANEMFDPKVPASLDADALVKAVEKGEVPPCIAEGPISFDIAFCKEAAEHKGIISNVTGDVDLLLFPNIETGNIMGKSWLTFNQAKWAGIVLGGAAPIILGSRSDTPEIKINSIALACLAAG